MKHFGIREAMTLANSGYTKVQLLEHFNVSEECFLQELQNFSEKNQNSLLGLLHFEGTTQLPSGNKKVCILDTSYILSNFCHCDDQVWKEKFVIVTGINEQLIFHESRGNKKLTKLFYMILDREIVPTYLDVTVTEKVPSYEDPADFEILQAAKQIKNSVVYTADKRLAIRCLARGIEFKFFKYQATETKTSNLSSSIEQPIVVNRDGEYGINGKLKEIYVFDKAMHMKYSNASGIIPIKQDYTVIYRDKSYIAISDKELRPCG